MSRRTITSALVSALALLTAAPLAAHAGTQTPKGCVAVSPNPDGGSAECAWTFTSTKGSLRVAASYGWRLYVYQHRGGALVTTYYHYGTNITKVPAGPYVTHPVADTRTFPVHKGWWGDLIVQGSAAAVLSG